MSALIVTAIGLALASTSPQPAAAPATAGDETETRASRPFRHVLIAGRGIDFDATAQATALRLPNIDIRPWPGPMSDLQPPFVIASFQRSVNTAARSSVTLLTNDGRMFRRDLPPAAPGQALGADELARTLVSLLLAVESQSVQPVQRGKAFDDDSQAVDSWADDHLGSAGALASTSWKLALDLTPKFVLTPPISGKGSLMGGYGGALGLTAWHERGWGMDLRVRVLGHGAHQTSVVRGQIIASATYERVWAEHWVLAPRLGLRVEANWLRDSSSGGEWLNFAGESQERALIGLGVEGELRAAYRVIDRRGRPILDIGPTIAVHGGALLRGGFHAANVVVETGTGDLDPLISLGGLELVVGLRIAGIFQLRRSPTG